MRRWISPFLLTAALLAALPAAAQDKAPAGAPKAAASDGTVASSPMIKVPFEVRPLALNDDGGYQAFMEQIAADNRLRCGKLESYGWTFPRGDQGALDRIVQPTMTGMEKNGYAVTKASAESSVMPNVFAFLGKKSKQSVLTVWVPAADAVMLLLCQAEALPSKGKPEKK